MQDIIRWLFEIQGIFGHCPRVDAFYALGLMYCVQNPKGILEDDILPDGTLVKKGGLVTYVPYAQGRMKELWGKDADEFRPERWLKDGIFIPASPSKFPAFQVGF